MITTERGRGAAKPRKPAPVKPRFGLSPQLAPAAIPPSLKKCFNKPKSKK